MSERPRHRRMPVSRLIANVVNDKQARAGRANG